MPPTHPKFRWRQFSLRTGVISFLLCCIAFGFAARWYHGLKAQAAAQRRLVLRAKTKPTDNRFNLSVSYAAEKTTPWFTRALRQVVDPDAQRRIDNLTFTGEKLDHLDIAADIEGAYEIDSIQIYCTSMSREFADRVFRAPGLKRLGIFCEQDDDNPRESYVDALTQAQSLQELGLNSPFVSPRAAALIAKIPQLSAIALYACEPESVVTLASAPKLASLSIQSLQPARNTSPDDAAPPPPDPHYSHRIKKMFDALADNSHLTSLEITGALPMNPYELDKFCSRSRLESLTLRDCKMGPALLVEVATMPHLKRLVIYDEEIRDGQAAEIAAAKNLESLTLGPNVSPEAMEALRKAMPQCKIGEW